MRIYNNDTWIGLCNAALARINTERIESLDDASVNATLCRDLLPDTIGEILGITDWKCARRYLSLTALAIAPPFRFPYQFEMPSDFVSVVTTGLENEDWDLVGDKIYANVPVLNLIYICSPEYANTLTPGIRSAIITRLASKLCNALNGDMSLGNTLMQESAASVQLAYAQEDAGKKDIMQEFNNWGEIF